MIKTIPSKEDLANMESMTPWFMRPNKIPQVAIWEECLDATVCDDILSAHDVVKPHKFQGCNATTREIPWGQVPPALEVVRITGEEMNRKNWGLDLDSVPGAYLQTYEKGDYYQKHVDAAPGQLRKFTVIVMLSIAGDYAGGDLLLDVYGKVFKAPRHRGTVIAFPSWIPHGVQPIKYGCRQTLNMGWWGPTFK